MICKWYAKTLENTMKNCDVMKMFPKYEHRYTPLYIAASKRVKEYPARFHKQLEVMYVTSGELRVIIEGKSYTLQAGDLYVVFPDLLHMVHESSAAAYLMVADDKMFSAYAKLMNCYKPELPVLRKAEVPELVPMVMQRLCQWDKQELEHRQPVLMGYVNALVGELLSKLPLVERNTDQMLTHRLILYLLENYTRPITLEDVAKALGYSKYHISHVIAETFGCNFRTLINSYRISLAQSLLLAGDMTVGEAADACGFQNQSSFNRVFLQQCGVTPSAFRSRQGVKKDPPQIYIR